MPLAPCALALAAAGCMPWHDDMHDGRVPAPWEIAPSEGPWEVPAAEDLDPDPGVVAIRLRASSVGAEPTARDRARAGRRRAADRRDAGAPRRPWGGSGHGMAFTFDGESWPDVTPRLAAEGDWQVWRVVNETGMDHPFHLHGFRFQVVGAEPVWKDTVNVPADETVEIAVSFDGFAGSWLFHCHILEHAERGMMGLLEVEGTR